MTENESKIIAELKTKLADVEQELQTTQNQLMITKRRYEIAENFSDVTIFDYNIKTKKIITQPADFEKYGMPAVIENGVEEVINSGIIAQRSKNSIRKLYNKIDNGAPTATATVYANAKDGSERFLKLEMVSIFDNDGAPVYAVGVRKDITDEVKLHQEEQYSHLLASNMNFIYEANASSGRVVRYDHNWAKSVQLEDVFTLSEIIDCLCEKHIHPNDIKLFREKQSPQHLVEAYKNGERIVVLDYRRKGMGEQEYKWFECRINLVQDETSEDIYMRVYISDINAQKKNEMRLAAEHKQYELAVSRSAIVYEINITKNTMSLVNEKLGGRFELFYGVDYTGKVAPAILESIHPMDIEGVRNLLSPKNLMDAYLAGKTELTLEYRRMDKHGVYNWFSCMLQLFTDPQNGDILCYVYIEDINAQKEEEISLLYKAQHDMMTGFYNKSIVQEKIDEFLSSEEGKNASHAFFIIDLDHFKLVNDNFGHTFGDAVISQTSAKIRSLFRNTDIFGRIGGDEFVVLMKNADADKNIYERAQEICDKVSEVYAYGKTKFELTVSVGLAVYCRHGKNFGELYAHSDAALYMAKEAGRNRYKEYYEGMPANHTAVKSIDRGSIEKTEAFGSNVGEYVFRILYEAHDRVQGINSVLELFGKHYDISRVYVFENSPDESCAINTFEWCGEGVAPIMPDKVVFPYIELEDYRANFSSDGIFCPDDMSVLPEDLQKVAKEKSTKSFTQVSIMSGGEFMGFVGFDECHESRKPSNKELNDYRNFANILGVFITEMRAIEKLKSKK